MEVKKIGVILFILSIIGISTVNVYAADASFSFYPSSGIIEDVNEGFTTDVLIDSGDNEITKARVVIKFDPKVIQLKKAYRNESLFQEWEDSEISTDNEEGIIVLSASTTDTEVKPYYTTQGDPDVFARLQFDIITSDSSESIQLDFQYSGEDEELMSIMLKSGSPSENVLTSKPTSATFSMEGADVPDTAIDTNTIGIIIGVILILVGGFVRSSRVDVFRGRRGTVVLSD